MSQFNVFYDIDEQDVKRLLNSFDAMKLNYKKDSTILSNVAMTKKFCILDQGEAQVIRYNFNGTKTIIQEIEEGDIFGSFSASYSEEIYIVAIKDSKITMFDYDKLINRNGRNIEAQNKILDNNMKIITTKLKNYNERIEILTQKTIRDKLLNYFNTLSRKQTSRNIILPYTLTDLSDYLSIDRSAMMREIKKLKEDGMIFSKGTHIKLLYK